MKNFLKEVMRKRDQEHDAKITATPPSTLKGLPVGRQGVPHRGPKPVINEALERAIIKRWAGSGGMFKTNLAREFNVPDRFVTLLLKDEAKVRAALSNEREASSTQSKEEEARIYRLEGEAQGFYSGEGEDGFFCREDVK